MTCTFEFSVWGSDDDVYFAAINQRGHLATHYSTLAVTAYHQISQVLNTKTRKGDILGPWSVARVVDEFNKHAKLATDSEPVTVGIMNAIIAIHQHALKVPEIVAGIEQCERRFLLKLPFESINKLHFVVRCAKGEIRPNIISRAR